MTEFKDNFSEQHDELLDYVLNAIMTLVPSCTLMFKQELPLMFPGDADVKAVQDAMFDPFEYLVLRNRDGRHHDTRAVLHADVQAGAAAHVPRRRRREGGAGRGQWLTLDVAGMGQGNHHVLRGDKIFGAQFGGVEFDH
ncbi:hypothetical protein [Mycobacterium tuberculosis]|uniref:hypothetical protein n=1 Tax=Mycobacterium tuberculosis TaxID=1773 RepID=UPI00272B2EB2|nr:hypothetical protein [Mycobacterium tuberculosis]